MTDIVLIAHGSPDPRHARDVERLAEAVRERTGPGGRVHTCYLDHHEPSPDTVASRLTGRAVAVPVLLTPAYHAKVDIPEAVGRLRAGRGQVRVTPALGPDELLLDACDELLAAAGVGPDQDTAVVLFAAGSSDSAAVATVGETIADFPRHGWGAWEVAALDGGRAVEEVVGALRGRFSRIVAVSFMVAEGILRDRMHRRCAAVGVELIPGALAHTDALAALVVTRVSGGVATRMAA